jgi:hypothetical protein
MQNRVLVKPVDGGWRVETPEEKSPVLVLKTAAVKLARQSAKALPGRTMLLVLRLDGSVESVTEHGADRPPASVFKMAPRTVAS